MIVDRESLELRALNNTYCTSKTDEEFNQLVADIYAEVGSSEKFLVFIASNGHPIPANRDFGTDGDKRIVELARIIANLGGYWETMVYLTSNDTYFLVGAAAPPSYLPGAWLRARESSSVYPNHPTGGLHGVLARGRGHWYSPLNSDPSGQANLGFYEILAQNPVAFPHPDPASSDEQKAFQYISNQLCQACNLRDQYSNLNIAISDYFTELSTTIKYDPYNNNADCTDTNNAGLPFCIVRQQLLTEFQYVDDIRDLAQNLQTLSTDIGVNDSLKLTATSNAVQANLSQLSQSSTVPSVAESALNFTLELASYDSEFGPIFGIVDTVMNFADSLTTDPSGNPTAALATTVANLANQTAEQFAAQKSTLGTQFDMVYQDWGKLNALGAALTDAKSGAAWRWDGSTEGQVLQAMGPAIEQFFYRSLMSGVYAIGSYVPACPQSEPPLPAPPCGTPWGSAPLWQQPADYWALHSGQAIADYRFVQPFNLPATLPTRFQAMRAILLTRTMHSQLRRFWPILIGWASVFSRLHRCEMAPYFTLHRRRTS